MVVNGNGTLSKYHDNGKLQESGKILNGVRSGVWLSFYENGSAESEGEYKGDIYFLINEWSPDGKQMVANGDGTHEGSYPDGSVSDSGPVQGGLRTGYWLTYSIGSDNSILMEYNYVGGKLEGAHKTFFEDGSINIEGMMSNDKRVGEWTWYAEGGGVESSINFIDGKKEGVQTFFDAAGRLMRTETYSAGELTASAIGG